MMYVIFICIFFYSDLNSTDLNFFPAFSLNSFAVHGCWISVKASTIPVLKPNAKTRVLSPSLTTCSKSRAFVVEDAIALQNYSCPDVIIRIPMWCLKICIAVYTCHFIAVYGIVKWFNVINLLYSCILVTLWWML